MRQRSPGTTVGVLLVACALGLGGVALAAEGIAGEKHTHIGSATTSQDGPLAEGHPVRPRQWRTTLSLPRTGHGGTPSLARTRRAGRTHTARLARAVAVREPRHLKSNGAPPELAALTSGPGPTDTLVTQPAPAEGSPIAPPPSPSGEGPSALYWGASIGSQLTGVQAPWDMGAVTRFEQIAGKQVSLVNFFSPFANCSSSPCSFYKFPPGPMERIREYGAIPVFSWSSQSIPSSRSEPEFQLGDVIAGTYDSYIRKFAEDARDWGHPFFLRLNWEMNGNWFPWSEGVNGNEAGEYVAAWRHVHDIFTAVGATNVSWVWCPNVDPDGVLAGLGRLYPGDEYVDWTGLDGYNWGLNPANPDRWRSFNDLYSATYQRIADSVAPEKPLLIGEMGSTEDGGSKAAWIDEALTAIPAYYPKIRGLLWFDTYDDGMDWPIETSASAADAFAEAIQSPAYVTEGTPESDEGPIPPPS